MALQRGPLVYCVEQADHPVPAREIALPAGAPLTPRYDPDLLGGVVVLEGEALAADRGAWGEALYLPAGDVRWNPVPLHAVPYYAWDNRAPGDMAVWLPAAFPGAA